MYHLEADFVYCMAAKYYICGLMACDKESGPFGSRCIVGTWTWLLTSWVASHAPAQPAVTVVYFHYGIV